MLRLLLSIRGAVRLLLSHSEITVYRLSLPNETESIEKVFIRENVTVAILSAIISYVKNISGNLLLSDKAIYSDNDITSIDIKIEFSLFDLTRSFLVFLLNFLRSEIRI